MIEISSLEYAFSKLDFKKQEQKDIKKSKETIYKIWYRDLEGKLKTTIRSKYDLERTRDIHKNIITMIILTKSQVTKKGDIKL